MVLWSILFPRQADAFERDVRSSWRDTRLQDEESGSAAGVQYVDGDPSQGRWNTAQEWEDPPPGTDGVSYEERSYYTYNHLTGESTDPRGQGGGWSQPSGGWGR